MSEKTEFQQPSTGTDLSSGSPSSPLPSPEATPLSKFYQSIYTLPLNRYIDCIVDNNLYALVISGAPSIEELQQVWGRIRLEAADKGGDLEYKVYLNLFKEVNSLKSKIDDTHRLIDVLKDTYVPQFVTKLNNLLCTDFVFDVNNPTEYDELLQRCYNLTGGWQLRLALQLKNYEALEKKHKNGAAPTREYYLSLLITLSDNAGFPLPETITVFEFYERMRRSMERAKQLKNTR